MRQTLSQDQGSPALDCRRSFRAAARAAAPAPSGKVSVTSWKRRMARFNSVSETRTIRSTTSSISSTASGMATLTAMPPAKVSAVAVSVGLPLAKDKAMQGAFFRLDPDDLNRRFAAFRLLASPPISAPFPTGTKTASKPGCWVASSSPMVEVPSTIRGRLPILDETMTRFKISCQQQFLAFVQVPSQQLQIGAELPDQRQLALIRPHRGHHGQCHPVLPAGIGHGRAVVPGRHREQSGYSRIGNQIGHQVQGSTDLEGSDRTLVLMFDVDFGPQEPGQVILQGQTSRRHPPADLFQGGQRSLRRRSQPGHFSTTPALGVHVGLGRGSRIWPHRSTPSNRGEKSGSNPWSPPVAKRSKSSRCAATKKPHVSS